MTVSGVEVDGSCPIGEVKYRCCSLLSIAIINEGPGRNQETGFTTYNVTTLRQNPDVEFISFDVTKAHNKPDNVTAVHENPNVEYITKTGSQVHQGGRGFEKNPSKNGTNSEGYVSSNDHFPSISDQVPTQNLFDCEFSNCKSKDAKDKCPHSGMYKV